MRDNEFVDWLGTVLPLHNRLAESVRSLLQNILDLRKIEYLSITSRCKTMESASEKIRRKRYLTPSTQLTDLCGIRVVTYLPEQVDKVSQAIRQIFEIDESNSEDQATGLGSDKVGYRSVHFVCTLGPLRAGLPEYEALADLKFEIQVRTVLQHAWAELAHDNSFKLGANLPDELQRKLNLHSASLEIVDIAFQEISDAVKLYRSQLDHATSDENKKEPINSITLEKFLSDVSGEGKFRLTSSHSNSDDDQAIDELNSFDAYTVGDLHDLFDHEFFRYYTDKSTTTKIGLVRSAMMLKDIEKYFEQDIDWSVMADETFNFLAAKYGQDRVESVLSKHDIDLMSDLGIADD